MLVSAQDSRSVEPASLAGRYVDAARLLEPLFSSISCTVFRAGKHTFSPDWQLAPVALPHYRFFIGVSGAAEFVVGGAPHRLEPCGVILVPPQVVHQARPAADSSVVAYVIEFEARLHGILDV